MGLPTDSASIKLVHGVKDWFDDIGLGERVDSDADNDFRLVYRNGRERVRIFFEESLL